MPPASVQIKKLKKEIATLDALEEERAKKYESLTLQIQVNPVAQHHWLKQSLFIFLPGSAEPRQDASEEVEGVFEREA